MKSIKIVVMSVIAMFTTSAFADYCGTRATRAEQERCYRNVNGNGGGAFTAIANDKKMAKDLASMRAEADRKYNEAYRITPADRIANAERDKRHAAEEAERKADFDRRMAEADAWYDKRNEEIARENAERNALAQRTTQRPRQANQQQTNGQNPLQDLQKLQSIFQKLAQ